MVGVGSAAATGAVFENCIMRPCEFGSRPPPQVEIPTNSWRKRLLLVMGGVVGLIGVVRASLVALELHTSKVACPYLSNDRPVGNYAPTATRRGGEEGDCSAKLIEELAKLSGPEFSNEELRIVIDSFADDRNLGRGCSRIEYKGHARRSIPHLLSKIRQAFFHVVVPLQRLDSTQRPLEEIAAIFAVLTVWGMVFFALKLYKTFAHPYLSNDMPIGNNAPSTTSRDGEEGNDTVNLTEEFAKLDRPQKFCYEKLMIVTNSFADDRILGRGGFGIVYEGHVEDAGTRVAVKIINPDSHQGKNEYVSEVKSLSQLRHKNLVQLIGYCHEANKFVLVYEFIGGGSLEDHLFRGRPQLTWERRYKIALGLALSLHYLHEQCNQCVIHRDIKSSNIMLDEKLEAKLGDFGLARLVDHTRGQKTTEKIGTWGYAAPEYCETGKASKESDVYSFGVVLLEIVCGRSAVDSARAEQVPNALVKWVWKHYGRWSWSWSWRGRRIWRGCWRRNLLLAVDERLGKDFDKKQAEALMITGLWCVHPIAASRPSIEGAMAVLNLKAEPPKLPPKMPVPPYN